jgi:acetoin utilization deacetylase AcuC-like enzyme
MIRAYTHPACARHHNPNSSVEAPERLAAALEGAERARAAGVDLDLVNAAPVPRETLEAAHSPVYLDGLRGLSEAGGGYLDGDTATNAHSWDAATLASGAAVAAVESAVAGTPAFALVRPPGHHAGGDYAMGFCLLNHAAVAAAHARSLGAGRVAVLDWDVHHGNGTQDIFYDRADVLYLSVHRSPFYPGTGRLDEIGYGEGRGFTVNVPLPARSGADRYAAAFSGVLLPVLREFEPEVVIVSAGYDAHRDDPLGGMALDEAFFGEASASVAALTREIPGCAPPALVLEGGYNLGALASCVDATVRGLDGGGIPRWKYRAEQAPAPVREAREAMTPFWESLRR